MIYEESLFLPCKEFVDASLSYLKPYIDERSFPVRTKIKFDDDNSSREIQLPDFSYLILKHEDRLKSLPQFELCENLMNIDNEISTHLNRSIGTQFFGLMRDCWHYLFFILERVIESYYRMGRFSNSIFTKAFRDFKYFVQNKSFRVLIITPLLNFQSHDISSIRIGKNFRVRKITNEEKSSLVEITGDLGLNRRNIYQFSYVIEYEFITPKIFHGDENFEYVNVMDRINDIITGMRLFKPGNVSYNICWFKSVLDFPGLAGGFQENIAVRYLYGLPYLLSRKEARKFATYYRRLQKSNYRNLGPVSTTIRRFEYAYDRVMVEDKLIDYIFAIESLFSKKNEPLDSLTYKLSLRFSRFLGKSPVERKLYYNRMRIIYNARSKIAHGNASSINQQIKDFNIQNLEDYLRISINNYLEVRGTKSISHDEVIEQLDFG